MSELPPGWCLAKVSDVGSVQLGRQRSPKDHSGPNMRPYLRVANVYENRLDLSDVKEMNFSPSEFSMFELKFGDILLNEGQSKELVGRPAMYKDEVSGACFQNTLLRFRTFHSVLPDFSLALFRHYMRSGSFQKICKWTTNIAHLGAQRFAAMDFPVPPLPEQARIVQKLNSILPKVDACRERLDYVQRILRKFREAVLEAGVTAKLTEDWRRDNRVPDERLNTNIESVASVATGSTPLRSHSGYYAPAGTAWVTSSATAQLYVRQAKEFVTEAAIKAHRLKRFPIGTLLIAMYGEGKTRGQVSELAIEATVNQACAAIVVDESKATRNFVKLALQANYLKMRNLAEGGNQPNLNLTKIKLFPLHLPSIREQHEIVRRAVQLFTLAERLEHRNGTAIARIGKLTPSILVKAFRGELVPQDPKDEPALKSIVELASLASASASK